MSSNIFRLLFIFVMRLTLQRDSPLISTSTGTRYFAAVAILNTNTVHDLNGLECGHYTLHTMHEQDSVVARHERTNYMRVIAHMLYSMLRDTCIYCLHATHKYLTKFLEQLACKRQVKIELYCSIKFCKTFDFE